MQDKKRNYLKDVGDCEEMQMLSDEMEKRQALFQARFQTLSAKSGNCRREANNLESDNPSASIGRPIAVQIERKFRRDKSIVSGR